MDAIERTADTAALWVLAFYRTSKMWWAPFIGRFKHVSACAYLPVDKLWIFYEVSTLPTSIIVLRDGEHLDLYARFIRDADLITIRRRPDTPMRMRRRLALTCVTAIRDLIGLDSGALLVDGLWRDCLAAGGEPFGRHATVPEARALT